MKRSVILLSAFLVVGLSACERAAPASNAGPSPATAAASATKGAPAAGGAIARIVFVDKDKCCACTRERIDKTWKALTGVVGFPPVPAVERIHMDSQAAEAAPYLKQRAIMVPPALYFFDRQGKLVEVLQGEVQGEQIKKILGTR